MEEFVARENVRHYEALLETSSDPDQQASIRALLENERRHLKEIMGAKVLQPH